MSNTEAEALKGKCQQMSFRIRELYKNLQVQDTLNYLVCERTSDMSSLPSGRHRTNEKLIV